MSTHIIEMIDLEIGKLTAARDVLVSSGNQSNGSGESITTAALLNAVDGNEFPNIGTVSDNRHKPRLVIEKRKGGMTPEGKARVAAAQKARWAKIHAKQKKGTRVA